MSVEMGKVEVREPRLRRAWLRKQPSVLLDQQNVRKLIATQVAEEEARQARQKEIEDMKEASKTNEMLVENLSKVTKDYEDLYESFNDLQELYHMGEKIANRSVVASAFAKHLLRSFLGQMRKQRLRASLRTWHRAALGQRELERFQRAEEQISQVVSFRVQNAECEGYAHAPPGWRQAAQTHTTTGFRC